MTLQRADRLKEPPVVGRFYLVPAIKWSFSTTSCLTEAEILSYFATKGKWVPVWGRKHNDIEAFHFEAQHYHIDPRFLSKALWKYFENYSPVLYSPLQAVQAKPLNHRSLADGPPKPVLRRMRCTMQHAQWGHANTQQTHKLQQIHAGEQCAKGKRGFVCPHRLFPLGSVLAIDGVITCPLHGLRIDAATGRVLGGNDESTGSR